MNTSFGYNLYIEISKLKGCTTQFDFYRDDGNNNQTI